MISNENVDFGKMSNGQIMLWMGINARRWELYFCHCAQNLGHNIQPDGWMLGWFANTIMAGIDFASGGGPINGDHAQFLIDEAGRL